MQINFFDLPKTALLIQNLCIFLFHRLEPLFKADFFADKFRFGGDVPTADHYGKFRRVFGGAAQEFFGIFFVIAVDKDRKPEPVVFLPEQRSAEFENEFKNAQNKEKRGYYVPEDQHSGYLLSQN